MTLASRAFFVQDRSVPRFSDSFKRELADATSIVDLVSRYVKLNRKGTDFWGCCPFHNEKSPSFKVSEVRKAYKCFGCGKGGDAYRFIMEVEGMGFVEAVSELADRAGMQMPQEDLDPQEQARARRRDGLHHANEVACKYFESTLWSEAGAHGQAELKRRGVDEELARKFRVGLTLDAWDGLGIAFRKAGMDPRLAEEAGLVLPRKSGQGYYDRFRNRLMFPISTPSGKVVAFGGRTLGDDDAKYINSPESPVYSKSGALYGLHQGRAPIHKADQVLVVEGYFDVIGLAKAGIGHAVAPCGTALTERQLSTLRRHTRNVVLLFDADEAGQRAAWRALQMGLSQGLWPSFLRVPNGKDPDDFVREHGADAMRELLTKTRPLLDEFLEARLVGLPNPFERDKGLVEVAPMLRDLAPGPRRHYITVVAGHLGLDTRIVDEAVRTSKAPAQPRQRAEPEPSPHVGDRTAPRSVRSTNVERELLKLLVQDLANVAHAVDEMGATSWIRSPAVQLVVGRMLRCWREQRVPTAMELLPDVDDQEVVDELSTALADEAGWYEDEVLEKATQECLIRMRIGWLEARLAKVSREIAAGQRTASTDHGLMAELLREMVALNQERDALRDHLGTVL